MEIVRSPKAGDVSSSMARAHQNFIPLYMPWLRTTSKVMDENMGSTPIIGFNLIIESGCLYGYGYSY